MLSIHWHILRVLICQGNILMLLIHWDPFDPPGIFLPFFYVFLNFPLHFQPPRNSARIFFFFFAKLHLVQWGGLNYVQFSHQVCSRLFIFLQQLPTVSFLSILFISLISSHSLTFSTKAIFLSLIPSQFDFHLLLQSQLFSQTLSSPSMAPKSRKSSYLLSTDDFHLTCWNGPVRLATTPPLTYRSQQHLSEGARAGLVSISNFSHFSSFPLIFYFNLFLGL